MGYCKECTGGWYGSLSTINFPFHELVSRHEDIWNYDNKNTTYITYFQFLLGDTQRRKPLTIITKRSILDVAAALDPPLILPMSLEQLNALILTSVAIELARIETTLNLIVIEAATRDVL